MPYVMETLPAVNGGVTERPNRLRRADTCDELVNALPEVGLGVRKRPPIQEVGVIAGDPAAFDGGLITTVRPAADPFRVVVAGGDLKVFDQSGAEQTVLFPEGKGYLAGSGGFRALVAGRTAWITNRGVVPAILPERTPTAPNEALVYVRQADYGTVFNLTVDGNAVTYVTPDGNSAGERPEIDTTEVAKALEAKLKARLPLYFIDRFGSTLRIRRQDKGGLLISSSDGLADRALLVIPGKVQRFEDLPLRAPNGYLVEVAGDPGTEDDVFWVRFDAEENEGQWVEVARPGSRTKLDPDTMPHRLVFQGALGEGTARSLPLLPTTSKGGRDPASAQGWSHWAAVSGDLPESGGEVSFTETAISGARNIELQWHEQYVKGVLASGLEGTDRTIEAGFSVDTRQMLPGSLVQVALKVAGIVEEFRVYESGRHFQNEKFELELTVPTGGADVLLEIDYLKETPDLVDQAAVVTVFGTDAATADGPRFTFWHYASSQLILEFTSERYPEGYSFSFDLNATGFVYTSTVAEGPSQIAASVAALINADAGFIASSSGGQVFVTTDPVDEGPDFNVTDSWSQGTHTFLKDAWFFDQDLVGATVRNLSDGSSGTITAFGDEWVQVASLTGGGNNEFRLGDEVEVVDSAADYFVFGPAPWEANKAGPEAFPTFVGQPIQNLFFASNRLGILAGDSVVMSRVDNHVNFFSHTAKLIRDDDPIDVESAGRRTAEFHTAIEWDSGLYLLSRLGLYALGPTGATAPLTPRTASLVFRSEIPNDPSVPPVVAGSRLYYVRNSPRGLQVMVAWVGENLQVQTDLLNRDLPSYISGTPLAIAADPSFSAVFVLTDEDTYFQRFIEDPREGIIYSAWSRWELPGEQKALEFSEDGVLSVVSVVPAESVNLGTIDISGNMVVSNSAYADVVGTLTAPVTFRQEWSEPWLLRGERGEAVPGDLRVQYVEVFLEGTYNLTVSTVGPWGTRETTHSLTPAQESVRVSLGRKKFSFVLEDDQPGSLRITGITFEGQFYPAQHGNLPRQESS
jgi:hypothetical protein